VDIHGAPGKDKEHGLERILGKMRIRCYAPADTQHHRPKSAHQFGKRGIIPRPYEPGKQLTISCVRFNSLECPPKLADGG
jgi:hypothetical protein